MKYLLAIFTVLCPIFFFIGADLRSTQEAFYQLSLMAIFFCFMFCKKEATKPNKLDLWVGVFGLWTLVVFLIFKGTMGYSTLLYVMLGILLYYMTTSVITKKEIPFMFKAVILVCAINAVLLTMQLFNFDPIFEVMNSPNKTDHMGFFGLKAAMGMYYAMAISLMAYFSPIIAFCFLIPIGISVSTGAVLGGSVSYLYFLLKKARKAFFVVLCAIVAAGVYYIVKVDAPMGMFTTRPPMWKMVAHDIFRSPVYGFGLNSFREGKIKYLKESENDNTHRAIRKGNEYEIAEPLKKEGIRFDWWDNPHNEYLQLGYEFGLVGVIIFVLLVREMYLAYKRSERTREIVAISGFFIALILVSTVQFPEHLARTAYLLPIMLGLFKVETNE